jgi:hypothetical protein
MNCFFLAMALLAAAIPQNATHPHRLQLDVAPTVGLPTRIAQVGVAVFDLEVNEDGLVDRRQLLAGQAPFVTPSRGLLDRWRFIPGRHLSRYASAVFIYQPRRELANSPFTFDLPLPQAPDKLQAPYPVRIVNPGYPVDALFGGTVVMQLNVSAEGGVNQVNVVNSSSVLTGAAVGAVRGWRFYVPAGLDEFSRTAIVTVSFDAPQFGTLGPATEGIGTGRAELMNATGDLPSGTMGVLATTDPDDLIFTAGEFHWTIPYAMVSRIEYIDSATSQDFLTITFTVDSMGEYITFRLEEDAALSAASILSSRTKKPIDFETAP